MNERNAVVIGFHSRATMNNELRKHTVSPTQQNEQQHIPAEKSYCNVAKSLKSWTPDMDASFTNKSIHIGSKLVGLDTDEIILRR